ncbi:E3 ubiquitin-protein ligase ubr-1 [Thelohanellus kitauei]|uniref:E3 ubiquitin-protein ligase n=1 Tax=Thelohanellus kitauei TaxID=669202 RepID=A0A0C2MJ13_THEKT|nr:E3 ubiquitin-protein ligase ubr-1 [Thelohanellus kitauei]
MEEIKRRIDEITINGLLVTSNDSGTYVSQIYSKERLESLVGQFLEKYVFEGFGFMVKGWLYSNSGSLNMCTKMFDKGDEIFECLDCRGNGKCVLCYECFLNSQHVNHEYKHWISDFTYATCGCGDVNAWNGHSTCSNHAKHDELEDEISESFLKKIRRVIQYLCELLEKIGHHNDSVLDYHLEEMLNTYLLMKGSCTLPNIYTRSKMNGQMVEIDGNARKSCLIVHLMTILKMSSEDSMAAESDFKEYGYACVRYLSDINECKKAKECIEQSPNIISKGQTIRCQISRVYSLYFMRLAPILISRIRRLCFGKTQLCQLLAESAFEKTSLAIFYVLQNQAWLNILTKQIMCQILMSAKYCDNGKILAAKFFLNNLGNIYSRYLNEQCKEIFTFLGLVDQIIHCPAVVIYLIENGFLNRMVCIFSYLLRDQGIKAGADVVKLHLQAKTKHKRLSLVLKTNEVLCSCLRYSFEVIDVSSKFRSRIYELGKRLVQFCFEFDDIQPIQKAEYEKIFQDEMIYLISLNESLFKVCFHIDKLLIKNEEIAFKTLELFLERFDLDIKRMTNENHIVDITHKIITFCHLDTDKYSMFNISHRVFIDIFMNLCEIGALSCQIRDRVLGDVNMLMWICRPAITALSSVANHIYLKKPTFSHLYAWILNMYRDSKLGYLCNLDINTLQLLISNLDPDLLLKYMMFNIACTTNTQVDLSKPISSLLRCKDIDFSSNLRQLLYLVYNALIERHLIVLSENSRYQILERQIIHFVAGGDLTIEDIHNNIDIYREICFNGSVNLRSLLDEMARKVSSSRQSSESEKLSLKPELYKTVSMFYFMYDKSGRDFIREKFTALHKTNEWKFELPDYSDLREQFQGMNNFLFSDVLFHLFIHILVDVHNNFENKEYKIEEMDCILFVSMILCLILKTSLNQYNYSRFQKTTELLYGIRQDLDNKNVLTLLVFIKKKINHAIFGSIVDYLIDLSEISPNYFSDLPENFSNLMNISRECRDLALKNLQNKYNDMSKNNLNHPNDLRDLIVQ